MKHKHHIIPRHIGGTDNSSNIIEVTIEEHAEIHKQLWEEHGRWQDWCAWQGLAGIIPKQELIRQIQSLANKGKSTSDYVKELRRINASKQIHSEEEKQRIGKAISRNHANGHYNYKSMGDHRKTLGLHQTEYQKQRVKESLEAAWLVTNPEGQTFNIVNLRQFCTSNNLDQPNMVAVSKGRLRHYKKWKCQKV